VAIEINNTPQNIIRDHGLSPKKSFGQNFMCDDFVNQKIAEAAKNLLASSSSPMIEFGAGTGALTKSLLQFGNTIHAIERDRDLVPILKQQFKNEISSNNLFIHEADGAKFDLSSLCSHKNPGVLVGNLPYHLTSSIIILALKNWSRISGAVFMVQKEVATRLLSQPNSKDYGFLTAVLNTGFEIHKVMDVDRSAFWPQPNVDSSVVLMRSVENGVSKIADIGGFLLFVRKIFQQRRKQIKNCLKDYSAQKINFCELKIDENKRPENLSEQDFLKLFFYCDEISPK
jgi:16S rRNA (adenine1518-N6/adenine1519-N6)-dimethyltransferase